MAAEPDADAEADAMGADDWGATLEAAGVGAGGVGLSLQAAGSAAITSVTTSA